MKDRKTIMNDKRRYIRTEERAPVLRSRSGESGSALVYILIAIALLAALTIAFMNPSSNQTTSQNTFKTVSEIQSQIDFIRSAIQECVLTYPGGDAGIIAFTSSPSYPIRPSAPYFAACGSNGAAADDALSGIRCPGNPGDNVCHTDIFGGATGKFLPPPPSMFNAWNYYNGDDGVFFWTYTTNTDAFINTVLDKLESNYSKCEADRIETSGSNVAMTSDVASVVCPDPGGGGVAKCFRIWMKINSGSAVYTEAGCP